jgi:trans-2-enoyl-CoA reductase
LKRGDVVVQNASNSAVGQAVIQICKAYGYKSVNVIRDRPGVKALIDTLYEMGASLVVLESEVRDDETAEKIRALMPKDSSIHSTKSASSSIKLAFNGVGGKSATNLARLLGDQGQIVTYGGMSREPITIPTSLFIFKRLEAKGFWLSKWLKERDEEANRLGKPLVHRQEMYSELFSLARKGFLKEPVHETWAWDKIKDDDALCKIAHFEGGSSSTNVGSKSSSIGSSSRRGLGAATSMAPAYLPGIGKRILTNF